MIRLPGFTPREVDLAELDCGEVGRGVVHAAEGLRIAGEHGYAEIGWPQLTLLAWAAAALGQHERAARLLGTVEAALDLADQDASQPARGNRRLFMVPVDERWLAGLTTAPALAGSWSRLSVVTLRWLLPGGEAARQ